MSESITLGTLKLIDIKPDASTALISEPIVDDALNERDDFGHVFGNTGDSVGRKYTETGHICEECIFPVRSETSADSDRVRNSVAQLQRLGIRAERNNKHMPYLFTQIWSKDVGRTFNQVFDSLSFSFGLSDILLGGIVRFPSFGKTC